MNRRIVPLLTACLYAPAGLLPAQDAPSDTPNIVLIIADDMTARDCGAYGNREVFTPNIDRLAEEGLSFDRMFTSTAMCAPTRQQLYTGIWPIRNGAYPNHSQVKAGVKSAVHHFRDLGYRVGLAGKTHFGPPESFPFETVMDKPGIDSIEVGKVEKWIRGPTPFFLVYASNFPHDPHTITDDRYKPENLSIPPNLPDLPGVREALAQYYAEISMLDTQVGAVLNAIKNAGRTGDTLVIFTSEQGNTFPFGGKWTCYESGLRTSFIVRWPGKVQPGTRTMAMAHYVDVIPTLIEAAGGDPRSVDTGIGGAPDGGNGFDGTSFLPVLVGRSDTHRSHLYGAHTTRKIARGSPCYPIRSVRDDRWKLIWNPNFGEPFDCAGDRFMERWVGALTPDQAAAMSARIKLWNWRPEFELFDLQNDPHELRNLAEHPEHRARIADLKQHLDAWMKQQNDQGIATEMLVELSHSKQKNSESE